MVCTRKLKIIIPNYLQFFFQIQQLKSHATHIIEKTKKKKKQLAHISLG